MGKDALSQSEIDSVINALGSGNLTAKTKNQELSSDSVFPYNFRRPNKFSKEQIRTLKNIHENFARMLANFLTAYMRSTVSVKLESINQITYDEFIYSLTLPTLITAFRFADKGGSAFLETNPHFSFPIIDILFGGEGQLVKHSRELTEIELSVMRQVNEKILKNLRYAWEDIADITPEIETLDTNPQFSQLLASNEAVALLSFSTKIAGNEGLVNLCLPYITLEGLLPQLSTQNWHTRLSKNELDMTKAKKKLEQKLKVSEVELTAVLGSASISVSDFLSFELGDIILLDRQVNQPVDLCLEGWPKFKITLGALDGKMAGVINDIIRSEEETE